MTLAERIIAHYRSLALKRPLPAGVRVLNPFRDNPEMAAVAEAFYRKYYSDAEPRRLILGINPGRFGAGYTGIPFTDTKRLKAVCGLTYAGPVSHEPSSVFIYDVIGAYGGPERFYRDYLITSVCPIGLIRTNAAGRMVNCNYYDQSQIETAVSDLIEDSLRKVLGFGILDDVGFCLGRGKNAAYLRRLNARAGFFGRIEALEHPRYIMQYRSKEKQHFVEQYHERLTRARAA